MLNITADDFVLLYGPKTYGYIYVYLNGIIVSRITRFTHYGSDDSTTFFYRTDNQSEKSDFSTIRKALMRIAAELKEQRFILESSTSMTLKQYEMQEVFK